MTGAIPLVFPLLISVMVVAILALAAGMFLSWREMQRRNRVDLDASVGMMINVLGENHSRIEELLQTHARTHSAGQQDIARNVETIQSDVEWMAGERMIEQAMALVRENMPVTQISRETGLSPEKIRTLAAFRAH